MLFFPGLLIPALWLLSVLQPLGLLRVPLFHLLSLLHVPLFHLLFSSFVCVTLRQLLVVPFLPLLQLLVVLILLGK